MVHHCRSVATAKKVTAFTQSGHCIRRLLAVERIKKYIIKSNTCIIMPAREPEPTWILRRRMMKPIARALRRRMVHGWWRVMMACALAWPCAAHAGVPEGFDAFNNGRYSEARRELTRPAQNGDAQAMAYLGEMLMRGWGGARDELKAREYILKSHADQNVRAAYLLGTMHLNGNLVARDEAKGAQLVYHAAEQGEATAQTLVGVWLANGAQGYAQDEALALTWFKAAAAQNDAAAMGWIGHFTEQGKAGIARDDLVALDWYKKAGNLGHAASLTAAGRIYALGRGVAADGAEALRWLRRAAAVSHYEAFQWIANVYEWGRGGVPRNPVQAYA
ncbi:MAG: sel1 repeat family protein [Betaproteobacteria bacterium]|nr:sel1 repeat family protein [Betaproteobacteria bacterium]